MPTRPSAVFSSLNMAAAWSPGVAYANLVEKPLGLPHCCSSALALATSPLPSEPDGYGLKPAL
jgi:hypothetical protein